MAPSPTTTASVTPSRRTRAVTALTGVTPSSSRRVRIRPRISSRIGRTESMPWPAGSSSTQSSYRLPGKYGQASPQPIVTTTSDACTASVVSTFGCSARMSTPTSAMASTATGLTWSAGIDPADRTSTAPPDSAVRNPAAIWERPALWTQTNRTLGLVMTLRGVECGEQVSDTGVDVGADRRDALGGRERGVADRPVLVAGAGEDGADVAAAHRHDDVGGADGVVGERLGEAVGAERVELRPDVGVDRGRRRRPGRPGQDRVPGVALEQGGRQLRAAGVGDADEQDARDGGAALDPHEVVEALAGEPLGQVDQPRTHARRAGERRRGVADDVPDAGRVDRRVPRGEVGGDAVEVAVEVGDRVGRPGVDRGEAPAAPRGRTRVLGGEPVPDPRPAALGRDDAGVPEHLEVVRHGRLRHGRELADVEHARLAGRAGGDQREGAQPQRVGQSSQGPGDVLGGGGAHGCRRHAAILNIFYTDVKRRRAHPARRCARRAAAGAR